MDYDVKIRGLYRARRVPIHEVIRVCDALSSEDAAAKANATARRDFGCDDVLTLGINTVDAAGPRGVVAGDPCLSPLDEALAVCRSTLKLIPPETAWAVVEILSEEYETVPADVALRQPEGKQAQKQRTRGLLS